jgi:hypothetical protein
MGDFLWKGSPLKKCRENFQEVSTSPYCGGGRLGESEETDGGRKREGIPASSTWSHIEKTGQVMATGWQHNLRNKIGAPFPK